LDLRISDALAVLFAATALRIELSVEPVLQA
jgi:hypothetical protein